MIVISVAYVPGVDVAKFLLNGRNRCCADVQEIYVISCSEAIFDIHDPTRPVRSSSRRSLPEDVRSMEGLGAMRHGLDDDSCAVAQDLG